MTHGGGVESMRRSRLACGEEQWEASVTWSRPSPCALMSGLRHRPAQAPPLATEGGGVLALCDFQKLCCCRE